MYQIMFNNGKCLTQKGIKYLGDLETALLLILVIELNN